MSQCQLGTGWSRTASGTHLWVNHGLDLLISLGFNISVAMAGMNWLSRVCFILTSYPPADWPRLVHTAVIVVQEGEQRVCKVLGLELAHCPFCCILLAKAHHNTSPNSREGDIGPFSDSRSCMLILQRLLIQPCQGV